LSGREVKEMRGGEIWNILLPPSLKTEEDVFIYEVREYEK
jgi:hypothetical protein